MFKQIISEKSEYKIGIYLGIALILIAIGMQIKNPLFEIYQEFDYIFILLMGIFIFFFFMGIALNTEVNENVIETSTETPGVINRKNIHASFIHLTHFNILSKSCFWISGLMAILSILRLGFIIWK